MFKSFSLISFQKYHSTFSLSNLFKSNLNKSDTKTWLTVSLQISAVRPDVSTKGSMSPANDFKMMGPSFYMSHISEKKNHNPLSGLIDYSISLHVSSEHFIKMLQALKASLMIAQSNPSRRGASHGSKQRTTRSDGYRL